MVNDSNQSLSRALDAEGLSFYRAAMHCLARAGVPFLVGGSYAYEAYTGISRHTKDFDVFVMPADAERALSALVQVADRTDLKYPHWLGKAYLGAHVVDVIFSSGNGLCPVDHVWFEHASPRRILGVATRMVPSEEMIWQKAFIMERHRFDGGDVIHLLHACRDTLDWARLLARFGEHRAVLLAHLLLCRFAYPAQCPQEMAAVIERLLVETASETGVLPSPGEPSLCRGTLLSLLDYRHDVASGRYIDARLSPTGRMTAAEIAHWTATFEW